MEYEIDRTIELIHDNEIVKVKVVKDKEKTCNSCFFYDNNSSEPDSPCIRHKYHLEEAYCSKLFRNDGKSIIYKQIK